MNKPMTSVKADPEKSNTFDCFQTPWCALPMIEQYLPSLRTIWEPACGSGRIVRYFRNRGRIVYASDIMPSQAGKPHWFDGNRNFLATTETPSMGPCIQVTNPPFSLKIKWTRHALELGRPFALLMPITFLEQQGCEMVHENGMEIIMPYQRIPFAPPDGREEKTIWRCQNKDCATDFVQEVKPMICADCMGVKFAKLKSTPQFKTAWFTYGLHIGEPITYYDMIADIKALGKGKSMLED